eukprot:7391587-Prymnesium_polylepis.2
MTCSTPPHNAPHRPTPLYTTLHRSTPLYTALHRTSALILHSFFTHSALILHSCTHSALILHSFCTHSVTFCTSALTRHSFCAHSALTPLPINQTLLETRSCGVVGRGGPLAATTRAAFSSRPPAAPSRRSPHLRLQDRGGVGQHGG